MNPPDIAVTGLGLVTSLGLTPRQTLASILAGRSGLGSMPGLEQRPNPDKGGGQAVDLPPDYAPTLSRPARYIRYAAEQALAEAGTGPSLAARTGAIVGTTLHGMRAGGEFLRREDPRLLGDFLAGSVLRSALDGLGIDGPRWTTCSACSSGLGSVAIGATLLRVGVVDRVLAGGYDSVSEYSYAGFDSLRLVAEGPPRPFAADRDGMKVAEGYGVLVLERAEHAVERGAAILAVVAGYGESSDAFHLTQPQPDGSGAARAIRDALDGAGLGPDSIDLISAHGTATPNNDAAEYAALSAALGAALPGIPVVAFKSHLGHTLGGAGAVELILSILAGNAGIVPPTAHTERPDPAFADLRLVRGFAERRAVRASLNLSLGFGGANTCVVVRRDRSAARAREPEPAHEAVITGIGVVLPGALGPDELLALVAGGASVTADTGAIPEARFAHLFNARRARRMSEYSKLSLAAATAACTHAGISGDAAFLAGCSAILGTTHGSGPTCEAFYGQIVREGLGAANPVLFAEGVPNAAAAHLSMTLGLRGGCQTLIGTRSAGLDALTLAALRIRRGEWPRAVVGAAEEYCGAVNSAYTACGLYGPPRGFATGSGAVAFVLEEAAAARSRGARVLGEVIPGAANGSSGGQSPARVLWTGLTHVPPDRAASRTLDVSQPGCVVRSVYGVLPELFSAGALAAVAAGILTEGPRPCTVASAEFDGRLSRLTIVPRPISPRIAAAHARSI